MGRGFHGGLATEALTDIFLLMVFVMFQNFDSFNTNGL